MYKKMAIATLIMAPLIADFASKAVPGADGSASSQAENASAPAAAPPPMPAFAARPQTPDGTTATSTAGIDPTPALDPNAGLAQDAQGAPPTPAPAFAAAPITTAESRYGNMDPAATHEINPIPDKLPSAIPRI